MSKMKQYAKLEMPEIFDDFWAPYFSRRQRRAIMKAAEEGAKDLSYQPNIALIVRTKNDCDGLRAIIKHVEAERKNYKSRIDLIVVDTESTDGTLEVAKKAKATIVPIKQKDFSYPKGINLGFERVKPDIEAAFITVGHALPAVNICLQAGVRHLKNPEVVAVYSEQVPNRNATTLEKSLFYFAFPIYRRLKKGAHVTPGVHGGLTQGTGSIVRMTIWKQHKFDEAYGHGGEDLAWGRWALKAGHTLIYDPVVITHHSHGLSFVNLMRQMKYWLYVAFNRGEFETEKIARYRPDLFN